MERKRGYNKYPRGGKRMTVKFKFDIGERVKYGSKSGVIIWVAKNNDGIWHFIELKDNCDWIKEELLTSLDEATYD